MSTSKVLQHLYSLDTSSPDLLRHLYSLIQNDDEEQYLSSLQGSELTRLIDFLDGVLDVTPITDDVSRRCLHKLQAICGHHNILPSSYNVSGDLTRIGHDAVASGGFADVWEGIHNGRKVCIKFLRITQQNRQAVEMAFCKEAVMWKRLRHPNIVGFIGVTRNPLQFVSEWMPSGTLTDYLGENPRASRIGLLLDVAEGLTFLHSIYTTHGDLKGPNILVDRSGHARLTDFGFTSVVRGVNSVLVTEVQGYSARWAAPEVLGNGDRNTREADVFAFGMIVIEVFTGRHPFSEFTGPATISKIMAGERPDRPQEPSLTDSVWDMTLCCWDQDPVRRLTMTRVVEILREFSRLSSANVDLPTLAPLAPEVLASLPESEVKRRTIICKVIEKEQQYIKDLDFIEEAFIHPLRSADPPVIHGGVDEFIDQVFGNILDLRKCNHHLLEAMYVRQREQGETILGVGDIFLDAATEFRSAYPIYIGQLAAAGKRLEEEMEHNEDFRVFLKQRPRNLDNVNKMDLKHRLNRPSEHLHGYPAFFEAIQSETAEGSPDVDLLKEAIEAMRNILKLVQLRTSQTAMGKGLMGKLEWCDFVPEDVSRRIPKQVADRQIMIFELIKEEMAYVKDLEHIDHVYVQPLRSVDPPIIPRERLETFIREVFCNLDELRVHHKQLLDKFFEIQMNEHPVVRSIAAPMLDTVLTLRDAYLEYIPNHPMAAYLIDNEMLSNPRFNDLVDRCARRPDANGMNMKDFINRPIPHLLRYELLLKSILEETSAGHEDLEMIPAILDVIKRLEKESEPGAVLAKQKAMWGYKANLVLKAGEHIDMDLHHEDRSLIYFGEILGGSKDERTWNSWKEFFVFLFDNCLVITIPKEEGGVTKYRIFERPIPLELTLGDFTGRTVLKRGGSQYPHYGMSPFGGHQFAELSAECTGPDAVNDGRAFYPFDIRSPGRHFTLFAESPEARMEWKAKLEEAIRSRKVVQESNKVFEVGMLTHAGPLRSNSGDFPGNVTCSVPFTAPDGRAMVAIGCGEGVWVGSRHDLRSMRQVLRIPLVVKCAVLEELGVFLVLATKGKDDNNPVMHFVSPSSLFACHIEALVASSRGAARALQTPQKLSGSDDVEFFTVGNLGGRTSIIYNMWEENFDSKLRVLEPVLKNINGKTKAQRSIGWRFSLRSQRSEWFRVYRDFPSPFRSRDLLFLKASVVILKEGDFEIMDLPDFRTVVVGRPCLEKPVRSWALLGAFMSGEEEFLLCYDTCGRYFDKHGNPSRMGAVVWEGVAHRVAWHPPYILLFCKENIEIRHMETGRLVQFISGEGMRCIWDGRGANRSQQAIHEGSSDGVVSQQHRVLGVMEMKVSPSDGSEEMAQHVFELVPIVPSPLP